MRLRACKELGIKEVPCKILPTGTSVEKLKAYTIKDNVGFGEHSWDELANEWDAEQLSDWGVDVPMFAEEPDYSILDEEDTAQQLEDMANGVKKAIQIEFEAEHYEEAYELVKYWREQGGYVGGMIMEFLKSEKAKG
jgi:ParB-like chromosome segregation protein Spo0J